MMSKTNIIVIIVAICLIIICLFVINKKPDNNNENSTSQVMETNEMVVNRVINESGDDEYIVYDKKTGAEKTRVDEEYQLKIYELDPDYEELPVNENRNEENIEEIQEYVN